MVFEKGNEVEELLANEKDLSDFSRMLKKITVEAASGAKLDDHLGYDKHQVSGNLNSRYGYSRKTLYTDDGAINIEVPRDRESSLSLVKLNHQVIQCRTPVVDRHGPFFLMPPG